MQADEFVEKFRTGGRFFLAAVQLTAGTVTIKGRGYLIVNDAGLFVELTFGPKVIPPSAASGVLTEKDCWSLHGRISDGPKFKADRVWCVSNYWAHIQPLALKADSIVIIPEGEDAMTERQRIRRFQRLLPGELPAKWRNSCSMAFHAIFLNSDLTFKNTETIHKADNCFLGSTEKRDLDTYVDTGDDYDFALQQVGEDLHLHIRGKDGLNSQSEEEDWKIFDYLIRAVALTHGFQPWPFSVIYSKNEAQRQIKLTAPKKLEKPVYRPFKEFPRNQGGEKAMRIAASFFKANIEISDEIFALLFRFRAGGMKRTDFTIRTMIFCTVLEGLVKHLFQHLGLEEKAITGDVEVAEFVRERDLLIKRLSRPKNLSSARRRLINSAKTLSPLGFKQIFQAVVESLGLPWEGGLSYYFSAWNKERHPLLHGQSPRFEPEAFARQELIAQAVYTLVLKFMNCPYPVLIGPKTGLK